MILRSHTGSLPERAERPEQKGFDELESMLVHDYHSVNQQHNIPIGAWISIPSEREIAQVIEYNEKSFNNTSLLLFCQFIDCSATAKVWQDDINAQPVFSEATGKWFNEKDVQLVVAEPRKNLIVSLSKVLDFVTNKSRSVVEVIVCDFYYF